MKRCPKTALTTTFFLTLSASSFGAKDPEGESLRISKNLRAYSDSQWTQIAGTKSSERYEIVKGDTLWDVSSRLFGDAKVWPKVWEINNDSILNPHMIEPRMTLVFNAGTGTSLPNLSLKSSGTTTVTNHYTVSKDDRPGPLWDERTPRPSNEWRRLGRQSWENVQTNLPPEIDKDGFDTRNRIYLRKPATGIELPHVVSCGPIRSLAQVEGSRSVANGAFVGSEVTIRATEGPLEVEGTYSLVDPAGMQVEADGRKALSYALVGRIKIIGVQSGLYIGQVLKASGSVERGAILIPEVKRIERLEPVAASQKVIGKLIADRRTGSFMTGQNKWVFINRGSKDGVEPGMLFRIFQNQDPKTLMRLTEGDVFVQGDVQVLQNCEDFSVGLFVWSRGEVPEKYDGMLLTDVTDERIRYYFNNEAAPPDETQVPQMPAAAIDLPKAEAPIGPSEEGTAPLTLPPPPPSEGLDSIQDQAAKTSEEEDWLDKLDDNQGLRSEEEQELRQLEKYDETQSAGADLPPPPDDELPPDPEGIPPDPDAAVDSAAMTPPPEELPPAPPEEAEALPPPPEEEGLEPL